MHLSKISIEDGQKVSESDVIGEMGGSANGSETGRQVHLHYTIQRYNKKTKTWEAINPTEDKGNKKENIVDPQKWIKKDAPSNNTSQPPQYEEKGIWDTFIDWLTPKPEFQDNIEIQQEQTNTNGGKG